MTRRVWTSLLWLAVATSCTKEAAPVAEQPTSAAAPVEPTPPAAAPPSTPPAAIEPPAEPAALGHFSEDLAVAWYDASRPQAGIHVSCDSHAPWIDYFAQPCVPEGQQLQVLDTDGVATWTTGKNGKLEREGGKLPDQSMMLLVAKRHAFPPDAKLELRKLLPPSKQTKLAAPAVRRWLVAHDEEQNIQDPEHSKLIAVAELPGRFGRADRIGVFEFPWNEEFEWPGFQALAALDGEGELVAVYQSESVPHGYEVAGVSDLDGDGVEEVLWWMRREDGVGLELTYTAGDQHHRALLMRCECGGAFRDVYRGGTPEF